MNYSQRLNFVNTLEELANANSFLLQKIILNYIIILGDSMTDVLLFKDESLSKVFTDKNTLIDVYSNLKKALVLIVI